VTYAHKIEKAEARSTGRSRPCIERRMRAFDPFPGATSVLAGETLKVWRAMRAGRAAAPSRRHRAGRRRRRHRRGLRRRRAAITELQRPGGKRLPAADFLRGFPCSPACASSA
jgi:methionyl-tRNA formyltransferase